MNNSISANQPSSATSSASNQNPGLLSKTRSFNAKVTHIAGEFHLKQLNRYSTQNGLVKLVSSPLLLASGSPAVFATIGLYQLCKSALGAVKKTGEQPSSNATSPAAGRVTERTHLLRSNSAD